MTFDHWVHSIGLGRHLPTFQENAIHFDVLTELSDSDLKDLGLPLGDRKRLMRAIAARGVERQKAAPPTASAAPDEAERRQLTVMFVDLVGSTALSTRIDPEEVREVLNAYRAAVSAAVAPFDGFVAQLVGDGVVVYFGYPQAHEDEAERAVRAGLSALRAVPEIPTPTDAALSARIGVATGIVVVGELISAAESTIRDVIGETPNVAARLQTLARPGEIVISSATRDLVGELFDLRRTDGVSLKGVGDKLTVYTVEGAREVDDRFTARGATAIGALVGRETELTALRHAWAAARRAEQRIVLLSGEAGIGKSRLLAAFLDLAKGAPHRRITAQCSPHHTESAFHPFAQHFRRLIRLQPGEGEAARLDRLEQLLLGAEAGADAPALTARLLGIDAGARFDFLDLAPRVLRARTVEMLRQYLRGANPDLPTLIVVEDVHWIDPSSAELLRTLHKTLEGTRTLALLTTRPDGESDFAEDPRIIRMCLDPLGVDQVEAVIKGMAGGKAVPPELVAEIVAKTDGVPLFIEEAAKMALSDELVEERPDAYVLRRPLKDLSIPSSLRDALMARLDRRKLGKRVAQAAACIGRAFDREMLSAASGLSGRELDEGLQTLHADELIRRASDRPDAPWLFKHALVRDAAYASMVRSTREALHRRIIAELEHGDAPPEVLAHHCERAGELRAAGGHLLAAGRRALEISAAREAIAYLERGLALIETTPESPEAERLRFELYALLGTSYMLARSWAADEVENAYSKALATAGASSDPSERIWISWGLWVFRQVRGQITKCAVDAQRITDMATEGGDLEAKLVARMVQLQVAFYRGQPADCTRAADALEALYDPESHDGLRDRYSIDPLLVGRVHAAHAYWMMDDDAATAAALAAARTRAESVGHAHSRVWAAVWSANVDLLAGRVNGLLAATEAAVAEAEERGFDYVSKLGRLILAAGALATGSGRHDVREIERCIEDFRSTGAGIVIPYFDTLKASALCAAGRAEDALETVDGALRCAARDGERWAEALSLMVRGDALALPQIGDMDGAAKAYAAAAAIAEAQGARRWRREAQQRIAQLSGRRDSV